jgi:hypothetical protein
MLIFALVLATTASAQVPPKARPVDPCSVLSAAQVAAAAGIDVIRAEKPDLSEIIPAQGEGQKARSGNLCVYETRSEFGEIIIALPDQDAAHFRRDRDIYFATFPGSAQPISNLGQDAWISAGVMLHLLIKDDLQVSLSTQYYQKSSQELLIRIAKALLLKMQ